MPDELPTPRVSGISPVQTVELWSELLAAGSLELDSTCSIALYVCSKASAGESGQYSRAERCRAEKHSSEELSQ